MGCIIYELLEDKAGIGRTLINIGVINTQKGDYDLALKGYERAILIQNKILAFMS